MSLNNQILNMSPRTLNWFPLHSVHSQVNIQTYAASGHSQIHAYLTSGHTHHVWVLRFMHIQHLVIHSTHCHYEITTYIQNLVKLTSHILICQQLTFSHIDISHSHMLTSHLSTSLILTCQHHTFSHVNISHSNMLKLTSYILVLL